MSVSRGSLLVDPDPLRHNSVDFNNENEMFVIINFVQTTTGILLFSNIFSDKRW